MTQTPGKCVKIYLQNKNQNEDEKEKKTKTKFGRASEIHKRWHNAEDIWP